MKIIITVVCFFLLNSCAVTPKSTGDVLPKPPGDVLPDENPDMSLEDMEKKYPFFNVSVTFKVTDDDPGKWNPASPPVITPEMKKRSRILRIECKEYMLEALNIIRFTINTPEFEENLIKSQFYSSRDGKTIKKGAPMDSKRLMRVLQKVSFDSQVTKSPIPYGADGTARVGSFLYEASDSEISDVAAKNLYIKMHNKYDWTRLGLTSYRISVIFHELLHNLGFNHKVSNDATYGMQNILRKTFDDPKWQKKYEKELQKYQYYQKKFANLLQNNDYAVSTRNAKLDNNNKVTSDSFIEDMSSSVGQEEICIVYEDGSSELVTLQDGKVISREKQNRAI